MNIVVLRKKAIHKINYEAFWIKKGVYGGL
jgi:hypothetical protein